MRRGRLLRDRLLHGVRRRRAWRAVQDARSSSVVFLCNGNICRSPYGEAALRRALPAGFRSSIRVSSMGLLWAGRPAPPVAQECAAAHGVDLSGHLSVAFDYRAVPPDELLVVMTAEQAREVWRRSKVRRRVVLLGDLDPRADGPRDIADPVDQPYPVFDACYTRIDRCVAELARALTAEGEDDPERRR